MRKSSICVVVPVYNAGKTLERLSERIADVLSEFRKYSIVFVDDLSSDNSFEIIKSLRERNGRITAVRLKQNCGQQAAVFCGLKFSDADYTVIMDDDLENDPGDILKLYEKAKQGYDAVYGVNAEPGKGALRGFGSRVREAAITRLSGKRKDKKVCSFRIMTRDVVGKVIEADTKFVYISLEILKHTKNIENVEVDYSQSLRTGYNVCKLTRLLIKMYVYYGRLLKCLRKKGRCYELDEVLEGSE